MEKAGGKGVYPARAFDFHRFLQLKKPASYASWTYFNFPLFFSFLIPLPISADEQQTVAISNSSWARFVRYHFLFHLSFGVVMEALKRKQSTGCPLESPRVFARSWLNLSNLLSKALRTTGGPSSSCEMIILRNKSHGEILLEFVWEYLRPFRNKKFQSNSQ